MDEQPRPDASAEATAPEASNLSATTTEPVDTSEGGAADQPQQQNGEDEEIQPSSKDDQVKDTDEPEIVEEAGVGTEQAAGDEKLEENEQQEEGAKPEEDGAVGEGSKTSVSPKNSKSAMVVLLLLEGEEKTFEKRVSGGY